MNIKALIYLALISLAVENLHADTDRLLVDAHDQFVASHVQGNSNAAAQAITASIPEHLRGAKFASLSLILDQPIAAERKAELSTIPLRSLPAVSDCPEAVVPESPFEFAAVGEAGSAYWLRTDAELEISTIGSMADTRIETFNRCGEDPVAVYDDEFGLAAVATVRSGQWFRVSQSDSGRLVIRGQTNAFVGGDVTTADTGLPLETTEIRVYDESGGFYLSRQISAQTRYEVSLDSGEYYISAGMAFVSNNQVPAHRAQIYAGVDCESVRVLACNNFRIPATRVVVASTDPIDGIDFVLNRANYVTGHIRDEDGHPITGSVRLYRDLDHFSSYFGSSRTDGLYSLHGIDPGPYFVTASATGFAPQLYPGIECVSDNCREERQDGHQALEFFVDTELTQLDFTLRRLPRLTGRVIRTATGLPVSGATVRVYEPDGRYVTQDFTDDQGFYQTDGLRDGDYAVRVTVPGFVETWFGGLECMGSECADQAGVVQLGPGGAEADIGLRQLGGVAGTVRDAGGDLLTGLTDEQVCFISGSFASGCVDVSADGSYELPGIPLAGTAIVLDSRTYHDQLFDRINCEVRGFGEARCESASGQLVVVEPESVTTGIDFFLAPRGQILVTVVDEQEDAPIDGALVSVLQDGRIEAQARSDANGLALAVPLEAGDYHVVASYQGYGLQAYAGVYCPNSRCSNEHYEAAEVIALGQNEVRSLQFRLGREPRVSFSIRGTEDASRVSRVCWLPLVSNEFRCSYTDELQLPPGSYRFFVESNGYYAQGLGGEICATVSATSCNLDSGASYELVLGQNLQLEAQSTPLPRFQFSVTGPTWSGSVRTYGARLYTEHGLFLGDVFGEFVTEPGRYKIAAGASRRYFTAHPGIFCESESECVEQAEVVEVGATGVYEIRLQVFPDYGIFGLITDSAGTPLPGIEVDAWNRAGDYLGSTPTNSEGYYWWAGDNVYHLSTRNSYGLADIVYPDMPCPGSAQSGACDPTEGALVFGIPSEIMENRHDMELAGRAHPMAMFFSGFEGGEDN